MLYYMVWMERHERLSEKADQPLDNFTTQRRDSMRNPLKTVILCAGIFGLSLAHSVFASDYPSRPITLHTMTGPGAQIDLLTRKLADAMSAELGQPVLVVNSPGGSHGSVMANELKNAKPDGYTLGVSATAAYTYSPHFVQTRYTIDDFEYLSMVGLNQSGLVSAPDRPWNSLKDAMAWAKSEGQALTYMFQGSDDRDAMSRIAAAEGVNLSLMPSTGGPSIISAVMGGHADLGHLGAILFDYVESDRLKLMAATTPERLTAIPDVPTLREQGWDETVEMFLVMAAPKGLPDDVRAKLDETLAKLAMDDELQTFISGNLLMRPVPWGPEHAINYMQEANERFKKQAAN
jgi:putative tricarboxylic transport membrane protein